MVFSSRFFVLGSVHSSRRESGYAMLQLSQKIYVNTAWNFLAIIFMKKGFTLPEIIIAISIFAILAVAVTQIFLNVSRMNEKIEIQEYVFTEASAALEKMLREVSRSTVDYSEYYSVQVLGSTYYGQNYGIYGALFYDPGSGGPHTVSWNGGDGIYCDDGVSEYFFTEDCDDFLIGSYDLDTGTNPYDGLATDDYNAFCEGSADCDLVLESLQDELYLISGDGSRKALFVLEKKEDADEYAVSMLELEGFDIDGDSVSDYWACEDDYICTDEWPTGYLIPESNFDIDDGGIFDDDFIAITPDDITVTNLIFFITPSEDPYRAFAEASFAVQQHPHVFITMTVEPSSELSQGLLEKEWTLTLQGVASAAVFDIVPSEYKGWGDEDRF